MNNNPPKILNKRSFGLFLLIGIIHVIGIFSLETELGIQGIAISLIIVSSLEAHYFVMINLVLSKKME